MIIKDVVVEKVAPGPCAPIVPSKVAGVQESGFPVPSSLPSPEKNIAKTDLVLTQTEIAKLQWTNPVQEHETSSSIPRYDFEGNVAAPNADAEYKPELYHHGLDPGSPGYSLEELFHLTQSGFQSQKALAVKALGWIAERNSSKGRKSRREFHRILLGEWKCHVRFSVACSDTSLNVRSCAWVSLLQLIEHLDKECGCVVSDLASIPEFFRAFKKDDINSVRVFLYIIQSSGLAEQDETHELISESVLEAAESFQLDPEKYVCGAPVATDLLTHMIMEEEAPAAEVIATLCDRIACISTEPFFEEDVNLFLALLNKLSPNIPFFAPGQIDEFSWTSRCDMVINALTEFAGKTCVSVFLAKFAWMFTSSLFPIECRAAVWSNTDLLLNISRLISLERSDIALLGNHDKLDFTCSDIDEVNRESALVARGIKNACSKFIDAEGQDGCSEMLNAAQSIFNRLRHK